MKCFCGNKFYNSAYTRFSSCSSLDGVYHDVRYYLNGDYYIQFALNDNVYCIDNFIERHFRKNVPLSIDNLINSSNSFKEILDILTMFNNNLIFL